MRTPAVPFSNGTEQQAWEDRWCAYCVHDHAGSHTNFDDGCELWLEGAILAGDGDYRWPEAWLPEPDDGRFFLPSRMTCAMFEPCHKDGCTGDPFADQRAEIVTEVAIYWQEHR